MTTDFSTKNKSIFWLFQPLFTHCMRPQADFEIYYTVFSPLQNGFKKV